MTRGAVLNLLFAALLIGCNTSQGPIPVPAELHGTWKTDYPGYEDRFFTLNTDRITIGTGGGKSDDYPVRKFDQSQENRVYAITYFNEAEGVEDTLFFYFSPDAGGTITFKNQAKLVWRRT